MAAFRSLSVCSRSWQHGWDGCAAAIAARYVGGSDSLAFRQLAGSARQQPPADELAGEAERLLEGDPNTLSPQAAREVLEFSHNPQILSQGLRPGGAASRMESDVAGAIDVRAKDVDDGRCRIQESRDGPQGEGETDDYDSSSPAASDPATRFSPWGH